ncbi:CgeB family protein [Aestuariimicrobium ganziense]|uniref:CgeB family protein n=1 Tax=Aestuariimicrobium ganziense TaxID=2773677 RepID=UPI001944BB2C|nr:glycosyltransferase [Aestuariimicrobium ganziense]
MSTRSILLVAPSFPGYWRSIERGFEDLGYRASTHCYDAGSNVEKIYNKLAYEVPGKLRGRPQHISAERVTRRAIAAVRAAKPDIVLVIRGDSLTDDFWQAVDDLGATRRLWLWDEIRRMEHSLEALAAMGPLATYSKADAASLRAAGAEVVHVLNAYDPHRPLRAPRPTDDITFVGARFDSREAALTHLHQAGVPVTAYGRDWSAHPVDRLRTFRVGTTGLPAHRDISLTEAWAVMRDSLATINIHGDQDGFTMRTFEAPGVGAVQLIDRPDVADLFEPEKEVLVFRNHDELLDQTQRVRRDTTRMRALREAGARRALAEHTFTQRARVVEQLWV